jgi:hypothetical protein
MQRLVHRLLEQSEAILIINNQAYSDPAGGKSRQNVILVNGFHGLYSLLCQVISIDSQVS